MSEERRRDPVGGGVGRGVGRVLGTFANAVLERTLPRIREWLKARLGPDATLNALELDGPRVHLVDARIPIGKNLSLFVARATLLTSPEELVSGGAPVRLERLEGTLSALRDGAPTFTAPIELVGRPGSRGAWVDADVRLFDAAWQQRNGVGDAAPLSGTARLVVSTETWSLADASFVSGASRIRVEASGPLADAEGGLVRARVEAERARLGHFLDALAAWSGREGHLSKMVSRVPLPWDALVDGTLALDRDGRLTVDAKLETESSHLAIGLDVGPDGVARASAQGSMAWCDLLGERAPGLVGTASSPLVIDASASGTGRAPRAHVVLGCERLSSPWWSEERALSASLEVTPTDARLGLELRGAARVDARASLAEGALDGRGAIELTPDAFVLLGVRPRGEPLRATLAIGGSVAAPTIEARLRSDALTLAREGAPDLVLRRTRARVGLDGGLSAQLDARVGPGSVRIERDASSIQIIAQRIDAASTVAVASWLSRDPWLGLTPSAVSASTVSPSTVSPRAGRFVWPADTELWADLVLEGGRLDGRVHVENRRSRLSLVPLCFSLEDRAFDGTKGLGTIAIEDALSFGLFPGRLAPQGSGTVAVHGTLSGAGAALALDVHVAAEHVGWLARDRPSLAPIVTTDASAELHVARGLFEVRGLGASVFGGTLDAAGRVTGAGDARGWTLTRLRLTDMGEGLQEALLGHGGHAAPAGGLDGLRVSVDLQGSDAALRGHAELHTKRSRLSCTVATSGAKLLGESRVEGRLQVSDLAPWIPAPVTLGHAEWRVTGRLTGSTRAPEIELDLRTGAQAVDVAFSQGKLTLPFGPSRLVARASAGGLVIGGLELSLLGGTVRGRGIVRTTGLAATIGTLDVEGVRIGRLALGADRVLAETIDGTLSGRVEAFVLGDGTPRVRARIELLEARYPALGRLRATLARLDLRALPTEGTAPLSAELRVGTDGARVRAFSAAVRGARVSGDFERARDGAWSGELILVAEQLWLSTSRLLDAPARLVGDARIPLRAGGTAATPRLRPDLLGAVDDWIGRSRLGVALREAIARILAGVQEDTGPRTSPRSHAPSSLLSVDALISRVATGADDADDALGALLERGLEPEEIADRVARRARG